MITLTPIEVYMAHMDLKEKHEELKKETKRSDNTNEFDLLLHNAIDELRKR